MRQNRLFFVFLLLLLSVTGAFFLPITVHAVTLPADPIPQRFSPPDVNGDTGVHTCMAAALTTALQSLEETGQLAGNKDRSYAVVRQLLRKWSPDIAKGIAPSVLIAATPLLTDGQFRLIQKNVSPSSWQDFLDEELAGGYPVIVHIPDRNTLFDPESQTKLSHVIVVYRLENGSVSFADSWDGRRHTVFHEDFAQAWGKGSYNWVAFAFEKNEIARQTPTPLPNLAVVSRHINRY